MTDPCDLGALEARRLIGAKQLSPVELLESCIARIEAVNPAVNAMVTLAYERARVEAKSAEDAVMRGDPLPPLHGLPVGIKDLTDTEGIRTTYGSMAYKDNVPDADEQVVAATRRAGGIILGKTNTPEFGAGGNTNIALFGATRNPFDLALTCGGSSGGSGVALATGMTPLAIGSDTGGACACRRPSTVWWRTAPAPAWSRPAAAIRPIRPIRPRGRWRAAWPTHRCAWRRWPNAARSIRCPFRSIRRSF